MAVSLSVKANSLLKETSISPQIILDIEGVDLIFGAQPVLKVLTWDDESPEALWDNDLRWDGLIEDYKSADVISLDGTTTNISQQIEPDKGSTSSISTVNISLVDKNNIVSKALSYNAIDEIIGRKATFAIGFKQGSYPEDTLPIYRGIITDYYYEAGIVMLTVSSPESLKRQVFLPKFQTELTTECKYKQLTVQNILYKQRLTESGNISIQYLSGGAVSVDYDKNTNVLTVYIVDGVTTADEIEEEIRNTASTFYAVETEIIGDGSTAQNIFSLTQFETDTVLNVGLTEGIILSGDSLTTYVRIGDEIMEVLSKTDTTITVERGAKLNSFENRYESEEEVSTFYRLQGKPLELALKIMLSNEGNEYFESLDTPKAVNFISITEELENTVIFDYYDIEEKTGLTIGDTFKLDSGPNTGTYTIREFVTLSTGDSGIVTVEQLTTESEYAGTFSYRSKWNTLPVGLEMLTNEVDVKQFESIIAFFGSSFVDYDFYIKDTIDNAKDFIDKELYYSQGLFGIPRKARTSVKFVVPPFSNEIISTLNTDAITNIDKIKQRRSAHKYLYNTYIYRYEQDSIEDKFTAGKIVVSSRSTERIKVGKRQLKIDSTGLRNNAETNAAITSISQRLIDRYQYSPTYINGISLKFKDGFKIEVGDVVPYGGTDTKMVNLKTGLKNQTAELYEVINKSVNVKTGEITINLLNTAYDLQARYGVFSLSSDIGQGSTVDRIIIKKTNDTGEHVRESDKWALFLGNRIRVRSTDYTFDEIVTLDSIDPSDENALILSESLSIAPLENYVIEIPEYDESSDLIDSNYKIQFCYMTSQVLITGITDNQTFDIDDPSKITEGSRIYVHSKDFQRDSFEDDELEVDSIIGNTVTLNKPLDFTPQINDLVDAWNFGDGGYVYRII